LLVALLLSAPAPAGEQQDATAGDVWIDVYQGEPLGLDEVLADLASADVIYLGEHHTAARHHVLQAKILSGLIQKGLPLALAIEQMEARQQSKLDRYNRGEIGFEQLAQATAWPQHWANYRDYRPILEAARKAGVPVLAINAPAETIRLVVHSGGAAHLPAEARKQLPAKMQLQDPAYERVLDLEMMVHAAATPQRLRPMIEAQIARDEAMAQGLADFKGSAAGRKRKLVVLCGAGHVAYGLGMPQRLRRRLPGLAERIVLFSESGEVRLSAEERAQARDVQISHEQLRAIQRPVADYLCIKPRGGEPAAIRAAPGASRR
jgi:uncharacterized iron-regulated protein